MPTRIRFSRVVEYNEHDKRIGSSAFYLRRLVVVDPPFQIMFAPDIRLTSTPTLQTHVWLNANLFHDHQHKEQYVFS